MSGPSEIGLVLQGVGALAQAFAIYFAAWMASNTFDGWRRQKVAERRIEHAERILGATYKARRALEYVRSPMMESHELHSAEKALENRDFWMTLDENRKLKYKMAQGYYSRLNAVLDDRRKVEESLPMARALFGEKVERALEQINRQFTIIGDAVDIYKDYEDDTDREFARSLREKISTVDSTDRPNKMNLLVEEQVKIIETALIPLLRLEENRNCR